MGVREVGGVCEVVHDYEDDYLQMARADGGEYLGIAELVQGAARRASPPGSVLLAFGFSDGAPDPEDPEGEWSEVIRTYRRQSRHEYPPIYRVSIRVEARALGSEETAAYWRAKLAAYREAVARVRREAMSDG